MSKSKELRFIRSSMENNQENDARRATAVAVLRRKEEEKREQKEAREAEFLKFLETFLQVLSDPGANITVEIFPGELTTRIAIVGLNKYPAVVQELVAEYVSKIGQIEQSLNVSQNFFLQMMANFKSPSAEIVDGVYKVNLVQNARVSEKHPSELAFYLSADSKKIAKKL